MPSIKEAMRRSMTDRGGFASMMGFIREPLKSRTIVDDVSNGATNFKTAIASWDNCMAVAFCK